MADKTMGLGETFLMSGRILVHALKIRATYGDHSAEAIKANEELVVANRFADRTHDEWSVKLGLAYNNLPERNINL